MPCCECHLPQLMSEVSSFDFEPERIECEDDDTIISDGFGRKVMQAAALEDLEAPEQEMLLIGSYPDRTGVLHGLWSTTIRGQ